MLVKTPNTCPLNGVRSRCMDRLFGYDAISPKSLNYMTAVGGLILLPRPRSDYKLSSFFKCAMISVDS